jgi:hypothetical protein
MKDNILLILENFCPEWGIEKIDERFCEGCENLNLSGCCNYSFQEKLDMYEATQRLKIGL